MGRFSELFKSMITPEESYDEYEDESMYGSEYGTENFAEETVFEPVAEQSYDEVPFQETQQAYRGPVAVQSPVMPSQSAVVIMLASAGGDCKGPGFDPWVGKVPWRRARQPIPVFLPGESHGQKSLVGCSPWGRTKSDMTEQLSTHALLLVLGFFFDDSS